MESSGSINIDTKLNQSLNRRSEFGI